MKTLYLLRHAKSSWHYSELDDFERPLNKRGRRDVHLMGKIISDKNIYPDLIISSPAVRAAFTARIISEMIDYPEDHLLYHNMIYEATTSTLLNIIHNIDNQSGSLILVGHNPGLTLLINYLADRSIDNLPTCGFYGIELAIKKWSDISEKCGKQILHEYPKKHQEIK